MLWLARNTASATFIVAAAVQESLWKFPHLPLMVVNSTLVLMFLIKTCQAILLLRLLLIFLYLYLHLPFILFISIKGIHIFCSLFLQFIRAFLLLIIRPIHCFFSTNSFSQCKVLLCADSLYWFLQKRDDKKFNYALKH